MKSIHSALKSSRRFGTAAVCAAVALCCAGNASAAPTLIDGGFENNPLVSIASVLSYFPSNLGVWGQENSTIVSSFTPLLLPRSGNNMLQMNPWTGVATQTGQAIDVSSLAAGQMLTFSAWFNALDVPGAMAGLALTYYMGNDSNSDIGTPAYSSIALDLSPATWQQQSVSLAVPVGAQYAFVQVYFTNASLGGFGSNARGFVDDASVAVPEPGSLALAGLACLVAGTAGSARRRRLAAEPA